MEKNNFEERDFWEYVFIGSILAVISVFVWVAAFILFGVLFGCSKPKTEDPTYKVTYTCYSSDPKFYFRWRDRGQFYEDTIYASSHVKDAEVTQSDFMYINEILSMTADTMYFKIELEDGRKVDYGFRSLYGVKIPLQISQVK